MKDLYDMILEDERFEYFELETKNKEECYTYNFIRTDNLAKFIYNFLCENSIVVSYNSILEQLEEFEEYHFSKNGIEVDCSLVLMFFEG